MIRSEVPEACCRKQHKWPRAEPRDSLRKIAEDHVLGQRALHGVAICTAHQVRDAWLIVIVQEPPARHANIAGWPVVADDPEQTKARQKEHALLIAQHARLVRVLRRSRELFDAMA